MKASPVIASGRYPLIAPARSPGRNQRHLLLGARRWPLRVTSPGNILDVEASHLAFAKPKHVSDRLVLKPVRRLPLERVACEVADGLTDFGEDRAVCGAMKAYRLDTWTDHGPLPCPVRAHDLTAVNVAAIHPIGPCDIVGKCGQHAVDVPRVKAIVDAFKDFDLVVHWGLSLQVLHARPIDLHMHVCIVVAASARGKVRWIW